MQNVIVPIVEGHGDVDAAGNLIRRVLHEHLNNSAFRVASPKRLKRNRIVVDLPRMLEYAAGESGCKAIIVIVDADQECARDLAANIARAAEERNIALPVSIVCPKTEYEAWFIASIETIRGSVFGRREASIDPSATCPNDVEALQSPKDWLSSRMPKNMSYKPTQDQKPLTNMLDISLVHNRSRSFRRFCHAVAELASAVQSGSTDVTPSIS